MPVVPMTMALGVGSSLGDQQPSPLTSPLLMEAGYVRTDDEDEARRKVSVSGECLMVVGR